MKTQFKNDTKEVLGNTARRPLPESLLGTFDENEAKSKKRMICVGYYCASDITDVE